MDSDMSMHWVNMSVIIAHEGPEKYKEVLPLLDVPDNRMIMNELLLEGSLHVELLKRRVASPSYDKNLQMLKSYGVVSVDDGVVRILPNEKTRAVAELLESLKSRYLNQKIQISKY